MVRVHSYIKAAGASLLIHITLLCLAGLVPGDVASTSTSLDPLPIEIEIEPSRLIDTGSSKLQFTSRSQPPILRRRVNPVNKITAVGLAPVEPKHSQPDPPVAPSIADQLSPLLPRETNETSVLIPQPGEAEGIKVGPALSGDKHSDGGGSGPNTGESSGSGVKKEAGCTGDGTGISANEGNGSGGVYTGASFSYGERPDYPRAAIVGGREGVVTIRVLVGTDGNPLSVTVQITSGHEDFDSAAAQAVKKWFFSPARRGEEPVASFHDVKVRFRLDETR